jgi:hypothetical protein
LSFQVQSPHNSNGYFTIYGDETDFNDHFNAKLVTGSSTTDTWARTGYLGFLRRTECSQACSLLDETIPSIASRSNDSDNDSLYSQSGGGGAAVLGGIGGHGLGEFLLKPSQKYYLDLDQKLPRNLTLNWAKNYLEI